eukprot:SAG31_NODE_4024_length_3655_cov_1.557087_2_plen_115_part_00
MGTFRTEAVRAVTFSFLCQLLEKYGTLIERYAALIEKASPCRFTRMNCFRTGFELFWIYMPTCGEPCTRMKEMADAGKLTPKVDKQLDFTEEGMREAFETLRGRRTAGKIVMKM